MKITLLSVGKIKEKAFRLSIEEYSKRLQKYCKLEHIEVSDEKAPENLSAKEMEIVKNKEGENLLKKISDDQYVIALEIEGKQMSSEQFSQFIENLGITGQSNIAFVIGGSLGLSREVLKRVNHSLSFSLMTFPHQLMKVILLEQIYRAFRIMKNEPYHK